MIDVAKNRPLKIQTHATGGSSLSVPQSMLERVSNLFTEHGVPHWKDHLAISVDNRPARVMIYLSRKADPVRAQAILDEAA